jgi:hypothetical protein
LRFTTDLRYFDEVALLILIVVAVVRYREVRRFPSVGLAEVCLVLFVVAGLVSSIFGAVPLPVWGLGLAEFVKGIAFMYLVASLPLSRQDVQRVGLVALGAAGVLLVLGLIEALDPAAFQHAMGLPEYAQTRGTLVIIKSLFLHPAVFGWLMVYASLFVFAISVGFRTPWVLPLAAAFDVGAFLSGRRTPILALVAALIAGVAVYTFRRRSLATVLRSWLPVGAGVVLVAALFLPVIGGYYRDSIDEYVGSPDAVATILGDHPAGAKLRGIQPRTALYIASLAIARDHLPFGSGLGRYGSYPSRVDYSPVYSAYGLNSIPGLSPGDRLAIDDTFWPSVLGETGVAGALAYAVFIITVLVRLWKATRAVDSALWFAITLGALMMWVQGIVASLTAPTYVASPIAYFVLGTAGAIFAVERANRPRTLRIPAGVGN